MSVPTARAETRGFRVVKGGGTFVIPVIEKVDLLSLELLTIDVQTPEVYTSKGVPVRVDGVAQIKVKGDDISIATASEQFLEQDHRTKSRTSPLQTLEGHLRAILGTMTVEEIYQNRDAFASKVQEVAAGDMANMGLGHCQLHHPRHPGRTRLSGCPRQAAHCPGQARRALSPRPRPTATP